MVSLWAVSVLFTLLFSFLCPRQPPPPPAVPVKGNRDGRRAGFLEERVEVCFRFGERGGGCVWKCLVGRSMIEEDFVVYRKTAQTSRTRTGGLFIHSGTCKMVGWVGGWMRGRQAAAAAITNNKVRGHSEHHHVFVHN